MTVNYPRRNFLKGAGIIALGAGSTTNFVLAGTSTKHIYNLKDFGIVAKNGDSTEVFIRAFDQLAKTGGTLVLPSGAYNINQSLSLEVTKDINIIGNQTILRFGKVKNYAIKFYGSRTDFKLPSIKDFESLIVGTRANAGNLVLRQDNFLFDNLELNLSKIDDYSWVMTSERSYFTPNMLGKNLVGYNTNLTFYIMKIIDPKTVEVIPGNNQPKDSDPSLISAWAVADLWCKSRSYYIRGEILIPEAISHKKFADGIAIYKPENLNCYRFMSGKLRLQGVNVIANKNRYGIKFLNIAGLELNNLVISGFEDNSLSIIESINVKIGGCDIQNGISQRESNYGCLVDSCQDIEITNSRFSGGFHSLSHGGTFPCRNIRLSDLYFSGSSNFGLDFHGNCSNVIISNINCMSGAYIGAINVSISNSSFLISNQKLAALVIGPERDSDYYIINNCNIRNGIGNALAISSQFCIGEINKISLNNSKIISPQNGVTFQAYPYGKNPVINYLEMMDNTFGVKQEKVKTINNHNLFIIQQNNAF